MSPYLKDLDGKAPRRSDQTLVLMTSLYLMLIGFFAVMNTLADHSQTSSQTVIDSVKSAFNATYAPRPPEVDIVSDTQNVMPDEAYLGTVQKALTSYLKAKDYNASRGGDALIVGIRKSSIFYPRSLRMKRDFRAFLGHVAAAAALPTEGGQRTMSIFYETTAILPKAFSANQDIDFRRASVLVEQASDLNGPRDALSTGLMPNNGDRVYFIFLTRYWQPPAPAYEG